MENGTAKKIKRSVAALFIAAAAARGVILDRAAVPVTVEIAPQEIAVNSEDTVVERGDLPATAETGDIIAAAEDEETSPMQQAPPREGMIDLNSATLKQLESLKGIGPAKARAISEYRDAHGGFVCAEEITEVKGIGPGIYEKIKDSIYVSEGKTGQDK